MKNPAIILLLTVFLQGSLAVQARAFEEEEGWQDLFTFSGWLDAVQSARLRSPHDRLTSRARLRLELTADMGWLYGFVSADGEKNWQISSESGIDLHEAWVEYVGSNWDLRLGEQIIIWGRADGVQITDMISPPDYTESISRDLDEIRMPVSAARLRFLGEYFDTVLLWLPFFKAGIQPEGDNPWAVTPVFPEHIKVSSVSVDEPGDSLEDDEFAFKVSSYLSGLDLAASVFYTWDDFPAMHRKVSVTGNETRVEFAPRHHRLTIFGVEGARPWSDYVLRFEAAYYKGRYYEPATLFSQPEKKDEVKWLGGIDWNPGNNWTVTTQLIGDHILGDASLLVRKKHQYTATLNISKKVMNQTLTLANMIYWQLDDGEIFDRFKITYDFNDAVTLFAGVDIFSGDDGVFGRYEENTQVWFKIKYSF
ncbi:MAG: hypothetical protein CSA26_11555 [Desulfobacterales bacterium]|nr:MAG: hypothetical protein CSA26_11555 [Desulfobacterales bacterium]